MQSSFKVNILPMVYVSGVELVRVIGCEVEVSRALPAGKSSISKLSIVLKLLLVINGHSIKEIPCSRARSTSPLGPT